MQTVDGFTHFVNENEETVFTLGSLFAVDANGKPTDALTYDFVPVKGNANQVIVTVTLDNDYLTAADRAFPVVIDPTVTVTVSSSQTADTCVCSYFPSTNYYLGTNLRTGYDSDYGIRRSYLKFNIPTSIPAGSVTNATLDIERVSGAVPTTRAYRVIAPWTSSTLTWNNRPGYTTINQSTESVVFREGSTWYTMNVTSIVQSWINGIEYDYGFVVIDSNESNADHWTTWYSSDANSPHKPELIITYSNSADILYTHYYDSTFSTDRVNQIISASRTAGMAYLRQFGLYFGSSGAPDRLSTLTDECPLGANVRCSSSCDPHHKNTRRNASILHNDAASNERVVFWTNHTLGTYCEHDKQTDECYLLGGGGNVLAGVYMDDAQNAIQFFHLLVDGNSAAEYEACMGITLIHETAHALGLIETYVSIYATEHDLSGYQCVMEYYKTGNTLIAFYEAIKEGESAFCSFCSGLLEEELP